MLITPKFDYTEGGFDTMDVKMLCIPRRQHGRVDLCIRESRGGWNYPIAQIQLHSQDLYVDFLATFEDAVKFGEEIARRWNECPEKR